MPRKYQRTVGSRNYCNYSNELVQQAVKDYNNKQGSLQAIGDKYGIPVATLYRKVNKLHQKKPGGQTALADIDETAIVNCIGLASDWGFPLESEDIRELVRSYLNRRGLTVSLFDNNMPGREWYFAFLERHKNVLSKRMSQAIKQSRAQISPPIINQYFDNLAHVLNNVDPAAIVNYDETNFTDDPGRVKVVVRRSCKRAEKIMDSSKAATSVMFSVSASGKMLPIYVVYKADHVWSTWTENGPPKARYNRSKSGWFDTNLFEEWFLTVALPYFKSLPEGPKVLIGDNLASHISVQVISLCEQNNIRFVLLPPNSTHLTQPLDVCVFRPIKNAWRKTLRIWKRSNKGVVRKDVFPRLLNQALNSIEAQNAANIRAGFEATGICPLSRNKILKKLPNKEVPSEKEAGSCASAALKEILQEARYGKTDNTSKGKRKKLDVQPGKSIAINDVTPQKPNNDIDKINNKPGSSKAKKLRQKKRRVVFLQNPRQKKRIGILL